MNLHINKKQWPIFALLSMLFAFLLYLMFKSEGYYGGGDNMTHYRYSRYAFELPKYLIYHWGKPFYTLLSAPFAQFGFNGVRFFNVLISILSGWVAYLIGKHFNYICFIVTRTFSIYSCLFSHYLIGLNGNSVWFCLASCLLLFFKKTLLHRGYCSFLFSIC